MKKKEKKVGNGVLVLLSLTRFPQKDTWRRGGERGRPGAGARKEKKTQTKTKSKKKKHGKKKKRNDRSVCTILIHRLHC